MDLDTVRYEKFESPAYFKNKIPVSNTTYTIIKKTRGEIEAIINKKDTRKIFIIGPCSIHNYDEAMEYAQKLKNLSDKVHDKILILMRVYLEKPRTNIGWKGYINDPDLNHSYDILKGIELSRKLLKEINETGIGVATEFLDLLVYPYIYDFVSFGTIGARTTESQTHRQFVSGLPISIGFKNSTSGSIEAPINAIKTAANSHYFLGIDREGKVSKINTRGNKNCLMILRGGDSGLNYGEEFVREVGKRLAEENLLKNIIIDCSHGNSLKDYTRQGDVLMDVIEQITGKRFFHSQQFSLAHQIHETNSKDLAMKKNKSIIGVMLESNLEEGRQEIPENIKDLRKGVSITDGCIGWDETEKLILGAYEML